MSAPVSGKFQDHYIALGVEPRADTQAIQTAYAKLAHKFHPKNGETPDQAKFDAINMAYEVLSDPALRAEFDKVKGVDHEGDQPKFAGTEFFRALEQGAALRSALLCVLYDRRRVKALRPSLSRRHLEMMLNAETQVLNFAIWYLKQRGFVASDDKSSLEITVDGMDYLEQNRPSPDVVMPLIKPEALTGGPEALTSRLEAVTGALLPETETVKAQAAAEAPTPELARSQVPRKEAARAEVMIETRAAGARGVDGKPGEPVLNVLNRALQRAAPEPVAALKK